MPMSSAHGRRVLARTRAAIDARCRASNPGSGRAALRRAVCDLLPPPARHAWREHLGKPAKGKDGLGSLTDNDLALMLYAAAWCDAYDRTLDEYLSTFGAAKGREILDA